MTGSEQSRIIVGVTARVIGTAVGAMARMSIAVVTFAILMVTLYAGAATAETTIFQGARAIPGDGAPAIENAAILVVDGVIVGLGRKGEIAVPAGATIVELDGKTVMPAIVSPHVHPGFQRGLSYTAENFTRETVIDDLNRALYFGVGVVMSLGIEKGDVLYRIRDDQQAGRLGGTRLRLPDAAIGAPNAGPGAPAFANIAYAITTEDEARRAVQELAANHVDGIKIWVDDRGGRAPRLSIPLSRAVIDEGRRFGLDVTAHIFYHDDAVALAEAGIHGFAHLVRDREMSDALIALMISKHVYVMPNLGAPERGIYTSPPPWFDEPYLAGMLRDTEPPELIERIRRSFSEREPAAAARSRGGYDILQHSVAKLNAAGAAIILGCDTGLEDHPFGYAEQKELELMVQAGMSPSQVIVAATSRAAEFLGVTDTGTLAPGKRADLLVLDANPLEDIRNTRRISAIYLAGAAVDRAALKASLSASRGAGR